MREIAEAGAAQLLLDGDAKQAEFAELWPQLARKRIGAVDLAGERRDLVLGKCPHRVAQHVEVAAEAEIKAGNAVLHHRPLPSRGPRRPGLFFINRPCGRACQRADAASSGTARPPATFATSLSIASAGRGLENRKPCISSQPASRSSTRCSSVSTPSATTFMPSAWPSVTIDWMIAPALPVVPSDATKARSTLTWLNGNFCR